MTTALSFLFVLGVLVFVHELGHFLVARWHGVRVITFSLGFGPKIVKFERGGTEYCISIIPLGGYVKLAGETVEENRSGAPDEFLSKSKWVRFQVYIAGPIMNILLAWVVLAGVLSQGADVPLFTESAPVVGHVAEGSPAAAAGLRAGDRILTVDGRTVDTWNALDIEILTKPNRTVSMLVARADGQQVSLDATPVAVGRYEAGTLGIAPVLRPKVAQVTPGSPAERAGVRANDVLVSVDGQTDLAIVEFAETSPTWNIARTDTRIAAIVQDKPDVPLSFVIERDGRQIDLTIAPEGSAGSARVGVSLVPWETRRIDPGIIEAFSMSAEQNWESTKLIGRTLRGLVTAETPVRQLMGPVAIAEMSGVAAERGWADLFNLMAMISLNLGLLNLMPIPVLDGGHILILAVEGLTRRDLSIKVKERILTVGAVAIVLLMVTVLFNDVARLLR